MKTVTTPHSVLPLPTLHPLPKHHHHLPIGPRDRALREENLAEMLDEFDGLYLEGNATDPQKRQSYDVHDLHQSGDVEEAQTAVVLDVA